GTVELGTVGHALVAAVPAERVAGKDGEIAARDLADYVVARLSDVDRTIRRHGDPARTINIGARCGLAGAAVGVRVAGSGNSAHIPARDQTDAGASRVRDVDRTLRIEGERVRIIELHGSQIRAVYIAGAAVPGERGDGVILSENRANRAQPQA